MKIKTKMCATVLLCTRLTNDLLNFGINSTRPSGETTPSSFWGNYAELHGHADIDGSGKVYSNIGVVLYDYSDTYFEFPVSSAYLKK